MKLAEQRKMFEKMENKNKDNYKKKSFHVRVKQQATAKKAKLS